MNTEHYRHMLLAKEKELVATLAQTAGQARQATEPDVQDEMDLVVRSEEKEALLQGEQLRVRPAGPRARSAPAR